MTHAEIRMYRMGTGDCFAIKFFNNETRLFSMLIDCGTWKGSKEHLTPYVKSIKEYFTSNNSCMIDLLVVTHEHKDHVHGFDVCGSIFMEEPVFKVDKVWMAWTEEDGADEVEDWKKQHGEKKMALSAAAGKMRTVTESQEFKDQTLGEFNGIAKLKWRQEYSKVLDGFAELSFGVDKVYKGPLKGMSFVKEKFVNKDNTQYLTPGTIMSDIDGIDGVKFYVLGPPLSWGDIKKESGPEGESYEHNSLLQKNNAFAAAILDYDSTGRSPDIFAFNQEFEADAPSGLYEDKGLSWRRIDYDWLNSSGLMALRMNSLTNNLSVALAIEFPGGRVMLFPGDAEYGSWSSWHKIPWKEKGKDGKKHLTEDLLNRTVFYKVAHHLSHNGTAKSIGLDMMIHPELTAMATLDYDVISDGWMGTMPNQGILADLISKTKGRLMIMNEKDLLYDRKKKITVTKKINEARQNLSPKEKAEFNSSYKPDAQNGLYIQYSVRATGEGS